MRGYDYQHYLPGVQHFQEIQRRVGILRMLELGHADFYLDASTDPMFLPGMAAIVGWYLTGMMIIRKLIDLKV